MNLFLEFTELHSIKLRLLVVEDKVAHIVIAAIWLGLLLCNLLNGFLLHLLFTLLLLYLLFGLLFLVPYNLLPDRLPHLFPCQLDIFNLWSLADFVFVLHQLLVSINEILKSFKFDRLELFFFLFAEYKFAA